MIDAGALWVEDCWMLAVNGQAAIPPVQYTAPGIQQPRTTARPISQPHSSDPILPAFSRCFLVVSQPSDYPGIEAMSDVQSAAGTCLRTIFYMLNEHRVASMGAQDRCRRCGPELEWKVWIKVLMDRKNPT